MVHKVAVRHCLSTQGLPGTDGVLVINQPFLPIYLWVLLDFFRIVNVDLNVFASGRQDFSVGCTLLPGFGSKGRL